MSILTAALSTELGWVMGVTTLGFITCFVGYAVWAWAPSNRERMEADSRLPLDDGDLRT